MSFLDEATIKTTPENLPKVKQQAGDDDTIEVMEKKSKKRPDYADVDGDGDRNEPMAKAFKDKEIGDVEEGKVKDFLKGAALLAALIGLNKAASENIYKNDPKIKDLTSKYEKAEKEGDKKAMADFKKEIEKRKLQWDTGKVNEAKKTVELPADTTFTLDLKHLMKKHMDEGKSQEDVVKLTKALMAKLHDKGKVTVDGTKVIFKENQDDTQLALPEPDAPDYLGDDGMDYEGGMAKSQMLKMKKYAMALCDMVEDETQLEAWVQSKITKASDYMSSVYHYLDYQRSKMNEENILQEAMRINPEKISPETRQMYDDGKRFFDIASSLLRNTSSLEKIMPLFLDLYSKELRFNSMGDQEKAQAIEALENTLYKFTQG
jgi:hypothetical protein